MIITLSPGTPIVPVGVAGPALWLINGTELWAVPLANAEPTIAPILIGWDRQPQLTPGGFDAVVPPNSQVVLPVPRRAKTAWLSYVPLGSEGSGAATQVQVEWVPLPETPGLTAVPQSLYPTSTAVPLTRMLDKAGYQWPAAPQTPYLVQESNAAYLRPAIAPSFIDTIHVTTAVNTLFNFTGNAYLLNVQAAGTPSRFVHRIIVAVSAACLFVLGTVDLTVGSPGVAERGRLVFAAAGSQVIDFGDGLNIAAMGASPGYWRAYTSAIATLDATLIGG